MGTTETWKNSMLISPPCYCCDIVMLSSDTIQTTEYFFTAMLKHKLSNENCHGLACLLSELDKALISTTISLLMISADSTQLKSSHFSLQTQYILNMKTYSIHKLAQQNWRTDSTHMQQPGQCFDLKRQFRLRQYICTPHHVNR